MSSVGYILKLTKGAYELSMSTGRYSAMDFIPPTAAEAINVATGTSANLYDGGVLVGTRGVNQAFSFPLRVMGASQAEVERGVQDVVSFLAQAGDESDPVYLEYLPNSYVPYRPLWGQNGWKRLEVIFGTCYREGDYFNTDIRTLAQVVIVELQIKPYAIGLKQRLAYGFYSPWEDTIGSVYGESTGLYIPEATVNLCTNPVFGNAADWDNDWTAAAGITLEQNLDQRYCIWGDVSARLICKTVGATGIFTMPTILTAATYTVSLYVKKPDSSAVTVADCKVFYHEDIASTYQSLGNGWYRVWANIAGHAAGDPQLTGISLLAQGGVIYLAGMQVELKAYYTPLAHGDLPNCAWGAGAHDSATTRTASYMYLSNENYEQFNVHNCTFRIVVKWDSDQTHANATLMDNFDATTAEGFRFYFTAADDKFNINDGTNLASTAAQAWSIGEVMVFHVTVQGGVAQIIYKNGVLAATSANTVPSSTSSISGFVGSKNDFTEQIRGKFMSFTTWDRVLSAGEVLKDYNNVTQVLSDGQALGAFPWYLHIVSGTQARYTYNDATHSDTTLACGVTGDLPADTILHIRNDAVGDGVILANNPYRRYASPTGGGVNQLYKDLGDVDDATAVGGHIDQVTSVPTTGYVNHGACYYDRDAYSNKPFSVYVIAQYIDETQIVSIAPSYYYDTVASAVTGEKQFYTFANSTLRRYLTRSLRPPASPTLEYNWIPAGNLNCGFSMIDEENTASIDHLEIDYYRILFGDVAAISPVMGTATIRYYIIRGSGYTALDNALAIAEQGNIKGNAISLHPHKVNHLVTLNGSIESDSIIADVVLVYRIYVIPRYKLL